MSRDPAVMAALGPCFIHGGLFMYDPYRVPSILVDPETGRPPDVTAEGQRCEPSPEALGRSARQPYCPDCAKRLNREARARGLPAHFDETDTSEGARIE